MIYIVLLGLSLVATSAQATDWADLWSRPDQRAQQLLDSGKPAAAAPLFEDPRRRAYAEIKAQDYAAAAKQLQGASDPESLYNRGNALARAGDLEAGLQAYEAALKQAPKESALYRDAAHNHELVSQQLQKQKQQQKSGQGKDQQNKDQAQQGKDQSKGNDQDQGGKHQDQQAKDQDQHAKDQGQGKDAAQQPGAGSKDQAQAKDGGQDPGKNVANDATKNAGANAGANDGKDAGKDAASQAEQEARAAAQSQRQKEQANAAQQQAQAAQQQPQPQAAQAQQAKSAVDKAADNGADKTPAAADGKPESEQALALDQWLRWIPDDPAGLLRRKFMIEHMLKQQRENQR